MLTRTTQQARSVYEQLAGYSGGEALYFNQGYWRNAPATHDEACDELARLLARAARLGPGQRVLDVGFGYGSQDLLWLKEFVPAHITGVNITPRQVAAARARVQEAGLAERIDLREGSATELDFAAASFDRVVALECAHHFDPRVQFFQEAYRVLRPGGRLATTDIVPMPSHARFAEGYQVPAPSNALIAAANYHDRFEYAAQLRAAGFENVSVVSIRHDVWLPLSRYVAEQLKLGSRPHPDMRSDPKWLLQPWRYSGELFLAASMSGFASLLANPLTRGRALQWATHGPLDYIVAVGDKPESAA